MPPDLALAPSPPGVTWAPTWAPKSGPQAESEPARHKRGMNRVVDACGSPTSRCSTVSAGGIRTY